MLGKRDVVRVDWNVLGCRRERLSGGSFVHDYVVSPLVRLTLIRTAANVGGFGYTFALAVYTISQFNFIESNVRYSERDLG